MKSYGQAAKRRQIKLAVRDEVEVFTEHFDLCVLYTLKREFGFGAERLKRFYDSFVSLYSELKRRYYDKDDMAIFGERGDTYELRKALLAAGYDYDTEVKRLKEG